MTFNVLLIHKRKSESQTNASLSSWGLLNNKPNAWKSSKIELN